MMVTERLLKMPRHIELRLCKHQQGAMLLIFAVMLSLVALGGLYEYMTGRQDTDAVTVRSLAVAQAALLGRATVDANHPGSLPCPDTNNDGVAETTSWNLGVTEYNCPNYIGRLPWRTLGLSDVRDGNGERLWYALSSDARDAKTLAVNSLNTVGTLQVDNQGGMVAVIFSSGAAIPPQQRDTAHENSASNYLDDDNAIDMATGKDVYESGSAGDVGFNDKVLALPSSRLFRTVERLVLRQIAIRLATFAAGNGGYPYAANLSGNTQANQLAGYIPYSTLGYSATDTLVSNNWFDVLAAPPSSPYVVLAARDSVQVHLKYCQGAMTLGSSMVVHCE